MRQLFFGGSFNPIHHGHLIVSRAVAETAGFGRVVLIPSAYPPHKPSSAEVAPAADRLAMCRLAAELSDVFAVNDLELGRRGPSYTIDTARALTAGRTDRISWLIGADTLPHLPTWHEPDALLREIDFVVVARPGWVFDWDGLSPALRQLRHNVVTAPLLDLSATALRRRVAAGLSIDYFTPPGVVDYIRTRGLYREAGIV